MTNIDEQIKKDIALGLIDEKLTPLKCTCGHTEFYDTNKDYIDFTLVEFTRHCIMCNKIVGNWSYGFWMP